MKVRLTKPWADHPAGMVLEPAPSVGAMLLANHFGERVIERGVEAAETAELPEAENAAAKPKRTRKRRRKRQAPRPAPEPIPTPEPSSEPEHDPSMN